MTFKEQGFVQLPPDSTGKKSGAIGRLIIDFQGESDPNVFVVGQAIVGETSGATGTIVGVQRVNFAVGEGQIYVEAETSTGTFATSENLKTGPTTYGSVTATSNLDEIFYQKNIIVDHDIPSRRLGIDARGAAKVTFSETRPTLSSFGGLITDQAASVRQYVHAYDGLETAFFRESGVTGSESYVSSERAVLLDTGGTASGAFARRTSHYYHPYQPGSMMRIINSVVVGDAGKDNVVRRWGLFDEDNGVFWEQDGSGIYTVIRSNTTGGVIDTRVAQADWNTDPLDGSVNFDIDVTKANLYWIDLQWLGVGVVKFGVYDEGGEKTTAHIFNNPNQNPTTYMRQATLPLRLECRNTDTAVSSSELKVVCSVVQNIGNITRQLSSHSASTSPKIITAADGEVPLVSLRQPSGYNGLPNHSLSLLADTNVYSSDAPLLVRLRRGVLPSGDSFGSTIVPVGTPIEVDEAASGLFNPGVEIWSTVVPSGKVATGHFFEANETLQGDVGMLYFKDQPTQTSTIVTAEVIGAGGSNVTCTVGWKDILS